MASEASLVEILERSGNLPRGVSATEAITAVMCALGQRLSLGEAEDLVQSLPLRLHGALRQCTLHPGARGSFGRRGFVARVAAHAGIHEGEAEALTRLVFAAVRRDMPAQEARAIAAQLPGDLRRLWQQDPLPRAPGP